MKKFKVTVDGQTFEVTVEEIDNQTAATVPLGQAETKIAPQVEKKSEAETSPAPGKGEQRPPAASGGSGGTVVPAPMPGSIIDILVQAGDTVKDGQVLLILEAMKMENEITAPQAGTIVEVAVKKGDTVNTGDPLVVMG
ncbi:MAG TPA: biotin/lipoyl-binding protein [Bacillota bacterium]|nr:biotin/lipoyl-binding protein [Bacillota bacterium]